ncbi:MAG: ribonuclease P protein component [Firmicutes bacterium]|nr:ribonuclease P protein component [Bacillota bacterium]
MRGTIKKSVIFTRAYRRGRKYVGKYSVLYVLSGKPDEESVYGITVTKKRGGAVTRNRIRRVLREAYRQNAGDIATGKYIVITARDAARDAKSYDAARDMRAGFEALGILKK